MEVEGIHSPTSMTMAGGNLVVVGEGPPAIEMRTSGEVIGKIGPLAASRCSSDTQMGASAGFGRRTAKPRTCGKASLATKACSWR
jgi:hypothetical protein